MARALRRWLVVLALLVVVSSLGAAAYVFLPYDAPAEDDLIFIAVLMDLARSEELNWRSPLVIHPTTIAVHPTARPRGNLIHSLDLDQLSWVQRVQLKLASGDLSARNQRSFPLRALPIDRRFAYIESPDEMHGARRGFFDAPDGTQVPLLQHVAFSRPGYARAGALVVVNLSPSGHGVDAVYFLQRSRRGWKVAWRRFIFYA